LRGTPKIVSEEVVSAAYFVQIAPKAWIRMEWMRKWRGILGRGDSFSEDQERTGIKN